MVAIVGSSLYQAISFVLCMYICVFKLSLVFKVKGTRYRCIYISKPAVLHVLLACIARFVCLREESLTSTILNSKVAHACFEIAFSASAPTPTERSLRYAEYDNAVCDCTIIKECYLPISRRRLTHVRAAWFWQFHGDANQGECKSQYH